MIDTDINERRVCHIPFCVHGDGSGVDDDDVCVKEANPPVAAGEHFIM